MTLIDDIAVLVERIDLTDLVVHEERARRVQWPTGQEPTEPMSTSRLAIRVEGRDLGYRFRLVVADPAAEFVADVEAVYSLDSDELEVDTDVVMEFAGRVAFMAVYPYLRASVFASAGRIGTPAPVMGIVRQGQFEAGVQMDEEEIRREFLDKRSELASDESASS